MSLTRNLRWTLAATFLIFSIDPAVADPAPDPKDAELSAAWQAASKTGTLGPSELKLYSQATLSIPADEAFVRAAETNRIMHAWATARTRRRSA